MSTNEPTNIDTDAGTDADEQPTERADGDEHEGDAESADEPFLDVTVSADTLDVLISATSAANDEFVATFTPEGLHTNVADPGSVLLADTVTDADTFESYTVSGEVTVGVRLSKLENFATVGDDAHLSYAPENGTFTIESGPVTATAAAVDPDAIATQPLNDDLFDRAVAVWTAPRSDIGMAVGTTASVYGDSTEIRVSPEGNHTAPVRFEKQGDTDDVVVALENAEYVTAPETDARSIMSEDYLSSIKQAVPDKETELTVWTGEDFPLIVRYEDSGVEVTFVQAPRLQNR